MPVQRVARRANRGTLSRISDRRRDMKRHLAMIAVAALVGSSAQAGTISTFTFNNDATSQISSTKTYTAKADPGSSGTGPATVNGVVFDRGALSMSAGSTVGVDTYTAPGVTYTIPAGAGQVGPLAFNGGNTFDVPAGGSGQLL